MKILVLCYEYPPVGGGGGRVASSVAAGLAARGHEVKVVSAGLRHLPRREVIEGVEVLRPESFRKREDTCSVPEMALYLATSFLPALRLCRSWKPDVIHAHFVVPTGALALALHWLTGIPYVLTAHLGDVPGGVPEQTDKLFRWLGPLIRPIWKNAAAVTAVSGFVAELAEKNCGVSPKVILNGVPMLPFPSSLELQKPIRLVMVGRLSIQKNPLLAVRALSLIKDLPWKLEVIGEGPLAAPMRELVEENGLADRVGFSGWLSSEQVSERLAASDILVMTSTSEGLPMAGIEALRHGLAIVGSRIGGLMDVVSDGNNGLLCDLSPGDFAEALRGILENPARLLAMRTASLAKARDFNLPDRLDDYERVLEAASR
ncbi:MAG: glycosyltransferase family 4 protein [Terrimicrobiaceae bacterium]